MTDLTATFHAGPRHRRRLLAAAGASLALGVAAFPLEWHLALAGGLLGTAFGLWSAARKEAARRPVIELTPQTLLHNGDILVRWRDVDHVDISVRPDRGRRNRNVLTVREFSRGGAQLDIHRLDISDVPAARHDEILRLSKELVQRACEEERVLRRHRPGGLIKR